MEENIMFSDRQISPTDNLIFKIIGDKKLHWKALMKHMHEHYPGSEGEWNYYNDGKRWLFKLVWKKKTVFWINMLEDTFRVTFWLNDKAIPAIDKSDLPEKIRDEFKSSRKYGAIRAISIVMNDQSDFNNVLILISIKQNIR